MANFWWQKLFLPEKAIFASPVFTMEKNGFSIVWQKFANPAHNGNLPHGNGRLSL